MHPAVCVSSPHPPCHGAHSCLEGRVQVSEGSLPWAPVLGLAFGRERQLGQGRPPQEGRSYDRWAGQTHPPPPAFWYIPSPNSAPASASAPAGPAPAQSTYLLGLHVASAGAQSTTPFPAQRQQLWAALRLLDNLSDHQHKFLYWCSFRPSPKKDFRIFQS